LCLALAVPPSEGGDYDPESGIPPGGYWAPGEAPEVAPPDGHRELIAAYILLPLGLIGTVSGSVLVYLTEPGHCADRLGKLNSSLDPSDCRGLFILNSIRTAYGAGLFVSGAVLLGVGLARKKRLEKWKRQRFRAAPWVNPSARMAGASLQLRF
jgi:hypothetical protein